MKKIKSKNLMFFVTFFFLFSTLYSQDFQVKIQKVFPGGKHWIFNTSDGRLWGVGYNGYGQLGTGNYWGGYITTIITEDIEWETVSCGYMHTLAKKSDGTIWGWGMNSVGQVGVMAGDDVLLPVQIGNDNDWKIIAAGIYSGFAIKNDGSLWSWGLNTYGCLGVGSNDINLVVDHPQMVGSDYDWDTIIVSGSTVIAKKIDGSLWGWGFNYYCTLGLPSSEVISYPTFISDNCVWSEISLGNYHVLALKSDGTLWTWGGNLFGVLGIDAPDGFIQQTPVQIGTDADWSKIYAGSCHNIALKTDGTIWTWGRNHRGSLGLNDTQNRYSPVKVNDNHYEKIFAGLDYTIVLDSVGENYCITGVDEAHQFGRCYYTEFDSVFSCYPIIYPVEIVFQPEIINTCLNSTETISIEVTSASIFMWQFSYDNIIWQDIEENENFNNVYSSDITINIITSDFEDLLLRCIAWGPCLSKDTTEIISFNITIPNTEIETYDDYLFSLNNNCSYQWFSCDLNQEIYGETNQFFYPYYSGNYAVIVTENNCSDTSECIYFLISDINKTFSERNFYLFYDINSEEIYFNNQLCGRIIIYDSLARLIFDSNVENISSFSLREFEKGIYFIKIKTDDNLIISYKILKI